MSAVNPKLHLLCGKIASGKSTLAERLARSEKTVLISEDDWLDALYAEQMSSIADYVRCAANLRGILGPLVVSLLKADISVVLDIPANTLETRRWMREIIDAADAGHTLHVIQTPEDTCLKRLHDRNKKGDHPFAATQEQFFLISQHHVTPTPDEGFHIVIHDGIDE